MIDSLALFFNAIAHEMKLGRAGQIQRKTELLANIRRRVFQRREHFLVLFFVTGNRDVNTGRAFVAGKANIRHRYHCQTRIFELITDDLTDLFSQSIGVSFRPAHNPPLELSGRDALDDVGLNLVSNFYVVEVLQTDTTLEPFANL